MEDLMYDLATDDEVVDVLLDALTKFCIELSIECTRRGADWIWLGDDLGSQRGMLMSLEMRRKHFKPRMKRIIDELRIYKPGIAIAYHSCGSMSPAIAELVEIGVDVLNPIQESAEGMDQAAVKREFGDRLTLMCGPDTQQFLNRASPDEIRAAVKDKIKELGKGGGYIFGVSHHVQGDTPDENISAMLETLTNG